MVKNIVFLMCLLLGASVYSQDNPKINGEEIMSLAEDTKAVKSALKQGDKYYKQGLYDAALPHYMKLYHILKDHSPLNYKIGVSNLYGINPGNALVYLDESDPDVTADYYCQKGIALVYRNRYGEAKEAFNRYMETLIPRRQKRMSGKINRFLAICDFSEAAMRDSVPVFIENMGPNINSFYDDYSAIEVQHPSNMLFFTSRRPEDGDFDLTDRSDRKEHIWKSPEFANGQASEAHPASGMNSNKHTSIAGVNPHENTLFYYRSKKRFGDIFRVRIKENGATSSSKRLRKGVSLKTSKETSITFAANGDAYFISDRTRGEGGKDIWYARKKGKKSYKRAKNMGSIINTPFTEESVYVTPDGNTLYFSSDGRPGMGGFDVYKAQKNRIGIWEEPVNMGYPVNSPDDDIFYRLTADTTIALLSSRRSGGFGGLDIYVVRTDVRIPFELSGSVTDAASGQNLAATVKLFDRAHNLPLATAQIDSITGRYFICMEDTGDYYLQVEAMEYRSVTTDLTLPTQRHAKIEENFVLERLLHPFSLSGHITDLKTSKAIQAEIILKEAGKDEELYKAVSDENTGFYAITLEDKINVNIAVKATDYFEHNEELLLKNIAESESRKDVSLQRSVTTYTVTGIVTNEAHQPLKASINVSKTENPQSLQTVEANENGKYEIVTSDTGPFLLELTAEGHFFVNSSVEFGDSTLIIRNFVMKKMESGAKIVIENILFNTGNATLRPESFTELNRLLNLLKENPTVRIEISGHTDNTGSATLNRKLSKNRALSVRNYLLSQGIAVERLEYEGYGFDQPVAPNDTEEGRSVNRRVEIKILD